MANVRTETEAIFRKFAAQMLAVALVLLGSFSITQDNAASCLLVIAAGLYALAYSILGDKVFLGITLSYNDGTGRCLTGE